MSESSRNTLEYVPHQVIDQSIVAALSDKTKVAAILVESDLDLLIAALEGRLESGSQKSAAINFAADLKELKKAAFGSGGVA
jgi:hypothetical protein